MISFDEAFAIVSAQAKPLGAEQVDLVDASGRRLAEAVHARIDAPDRATSAMDGYAVRESDLDTLPANLVVVQENFAGAAEAGAIAAGECARIYTGAPLPAGADRVIVQEVVNRSGNLAIFDAPLSEARHIREKGSDFAKGDQLLSAGRLLDPRALVAAAGGDHAQVSCWRQPRLRLLSTGDELARPGSARETPGAIPNSLSVGIAAFTDQWGGRLLASEVLPDVLTDMERAAENALKDADLVVVTGGASVGERDFAKAMFAPSGLELLFDKVAMKPGKPVWLGRAQGRLVMGLPGNPTSAMVTARLLLAPLLTVLGGGTPSSALTWRKLLLNGELASGGPRETFVRARLDDGRVSPLGNQESSAQHTLADADLLVRVPSHAPAHSSGDLVDVLPF